MSSSIQFYAFVVVGVASAAIFIVVSCCVFVGCRKSSKTVSLNVAPFVSHHEESSQPKPQPTVVYTTELSQIWSLSDDIPAPRPGYRHEDRLKYDGYKPKPKSETAQDNIYESIPDVKLRNDDIRQRSKLGSPANSVNIMREIVQKQATARRLPKYESISDNVLPDFHAIQPSLEYDYVRIKQSSANFK